MSQKHFKITYLKMCTECSKQKRVRKRETKFRKVRNMYLSLSLCIFFFHSCVKHKFHENLIRWSSIIIYDLESVVKQDDLLHSINSPHENNNSQQWKIFYKPRALKLTLGVELENYFSQCQPRVGGDLPSVLQKNL